jgi:cobalt-zinc-cadmium efflux system outer membrane protein
MQRALLSGCACLAVGLVGCTASPLDERWHQPRPLGRDMPAYRAPQTPTPNDAPATAPAELKDKPLALNRAVAAALMHNPELAGFAWDVRAAEARAMQAKLWPNPSLEVETEGIGQDSDSLGLKQTQTKIRLSQPILTGSEIDKRTRVAKLGQDLSTWDYEAKRLDVLTNVAQRYIDVLAAQRQVEVAQQTVDLAKQVRQTVSQQVEAGEVSSIERRRATVELSESRIELQQTERQLSAARAGLAGAIGVKQPDFGQVTGELKPELDQVPALDILLTRVKQNPAIARWATERAQRDAQIELAEAEALPDVRVTAGLQRFNERDDYAGILSVGLPLPIFDRNQGEILEARFSLAAARSRQQAAQVQIRTDVAQAYQALQSVRSEIQTLEQETLLAARSTYRDIRTTYRQGERPLLDVLDAQRTLFDLEARHVEALASYHRTAARIEGLTGQALEASANVTNEPASQPNQTK